MTEIFSISRIASLALASMLSTSAFAAKGDWDQVAQALGKSGSEMPGDVYRVGFAAERPKGNARRCRA
jgi:hypothetical protein